MNIQFLVEEKVNGLGLFLPEPSEIFWSVVVTLIIVIAFYKFILPKLNEVLQKRQDSVQNDLIQAANKNKEADSLIDQYNDKLNNAKKEATKIVENANMHAEKLKADANIQADKQAKQKIDNAEAQIDNLVKSAEDQIKGETVKLAAQIAEKMMRTKLQSKEEQTKNIDDFIESVE